MTDPELERLALIVLLQAPFTFRLGFAVRDGREWLFGGLFLVLGGSVAAAGGFLSGSLLVGVGAALAAVFVLATPASWGRSVPRLRRPPRRRRPCRSRRHLPPRLPLLPCRQRIRTHTSPRHPIRSLPASLS